MDCETVRKVVEESNNLLKNSIILAKVVTYLNQVDVNNQDEITDLLLNDSLKLNLNKNYLNSYQETFKQLRNTYTECNNEIKTHEWLCTETTNSNYNFYFNVNDQKTFSWIEPDSYVESKKLITYKTVAVSSSSSNPLVNLFYFMRFFLHLKGTNENHDKGK